MESCFHYAESVKRKRKKEKALQEGQEEQQQLEELKRIERMEQERRAAEKKRLAAARQEAAGARRKRGRRRPDRKRPLPTPALKGNQDRLLLESRDMDLFETGRTATTAVCPQCHHELARVVCLGVAVRVCVECKGAWFPYSVLREFARSNEWFQQLKPATEKALKSRRK